MNGNGYMVRDSFPFGGDAIVKNSTQHAFKDTVQPTQLSWKLHLWKKFMAVTPMI